jgi:hypothetical protein
MSSTRTPSSAVASTSGTVLVGSPAAVHASMPPASSPMMFS